MTVPQRSETGLTPPQHLLLSYLHGCAAVSELNARPPGWVFGSVHDLLDTHGVFFTAAPLPRQLPKMADRLCYGNAASTAATYAGDGLIYAEGFATTTVGAQLLPLPHGWCVTPDGTVIDPTWDHQPGMAYFGIAFPNPAMWPHDGGGLPTEPDQLLPLLRDGLTSDALRVLDPHC